MYNEGLWVIGDYLQIRKSHVIQHGKTALTVEQPENGRIKKLLIGAGHHSVREVARPWRAFYRGFFINVCLEKQLSRADASDPFQRILRMFQTIENA
jgi:hypothetical protein